MADDQTLGEAFLQVLERIFLRERSERRRGRIGACALHAHGMAGLAALRDAPAGDRIRTEFAFDYHGAGDYAPRPASDAAAPTTAEKD